MKIIKTTLVFLGLSLIISTSGFCLDKKAILTQAASEYQSGDFEKSVLSYQELIKAGFVSAEIYYNLGNAQFRSGKLALALISYQRSLRLNPRDQDARWNLNILRSVFTDKADEASENLALSSVYYVLSWVSLDELCLATFSLALILAILAFLTLCFQSIKSWVRGVRPLFIICLVVSLTALGFKYLDSKDPRVVVTAQEVTARYGPSNRETQAFKLHLGAEVALKDVAGDWFFVEFGKKNTGWIPKSACEQV